LLTAASPVFPDDVTAGAVNNITGFVAVQHNANIADGLKLYYALDGLEKNDVSSKGGMHIHEGTTCGVSGEPLYGGHYFKTDNNSNGGADPWTTQYTTSASADDAGSASGWTDAIKSGHGYDDNLGKVVVLHNTIGVPMACSILTEATGGIHVRYHIPY
jgi:hypothetical protein